MNYYLVNVEKLGGVITHPEIEHKKYRNAGYSPEMSNPLAFDCQCIWVCPDNIDLIEDVKNEDKEKLQKITKTEAQNYITEWKST